jgi:predicted TIM-barrel fold metal-dependent hydrolase
MQLLEIPYYSQRPLIHLILGGVFERHPKLKYTLTEIGSAWVVPMLQQLDTLIERVGSGASGEMRYTADDMALTMTATEMFHQNCHMGASMAGPADVASRKELGLNAVMWGSDYPHDEGTYPYSLERIRHAFRDVPTDETFALLCGNAADLYGFDVDALVPLGNEVGPTVAEVQVPLAPEDEAKIPKRV